MLGNLMDDEETFYSTSLVGIEDAGKLPQQLLRVDLKLSRMRKSIERRVYSFLNALSDIGGIFSAVALVFTFLVHTFCTDLFYIEILNRTFCVSISKIKESDLQILEKQWERVIAPLPN